MTPILRGARESRGMPKFAHEGLLQKLTFNPDAGSGARFFFRGFVPFRVVFSGSVGAESRSCESGDSGKPEDEFVGTTVLKRLRGPQV